jgi:hypothetical protein
MDDSRFDALARALARPRTRRSVLAGVTALAAGVLVRRADGGAAPECRSEGHPCEGNQTCCDGLVCAVSGPGNVARCTPCPDGQIACGGVCIPECVAIDACHLAGVCDPVARACTNPPALAGTACDDGNACTQTDLCDGSGTCVGHDSVVCAPLDQCHVAGVCDPLTGACSNPNAPDGISCNDENACTSGDVCVGGACVGGTLVDCSTGNPCVTDLCDPAVGCYSVPKEAGTSCDADDDACTVGDACDGGGACIPGQERTCAPCLRCNPADGTCEVDPDQVGQACPGDGDRCFGGFQCNAGGACVGVQPVVCTAVDQCHVAGVCDPMTGVCSNPDAPDGDPCDDGDACTQTDTCQAGVCEGTDPVVCDDGNACTTDTCDPATGACESTPDTGGTCLTESDATGTCAAGECCVPLQGSCNVTDDCCDPSNVCASAVIGQPKTCILPPACNRPLQRERAEFGSGTAGTTQCQRTPTACEQTITVNLVGAYPNRAYDVYIDQNSRGDEFHRYAGTFTTSGTGNATFTSTITVPGTCPTVVDNELVFRGAGVGDHQFIQNSFTPCRFCS